MIIHSLIIWVNAVVVIPSALFHAIRDLMVPIMATHLQDGEFLPKFSWICWPNYTYENVILGGSCHWWDFFFFKNSGSAFFMAHNCTDVLFILHTGRTAVN